MPVWLQWLIWAGGGIAAVGVIWTKLLRPLSRSVACLEAMFPLLHELTEQLKGSPSSFQILKEIIAEFRSDSGSTLRDVVNRLESAAGENRAAAEILKVKAEVLEVGVAAAKQLSVEDRAAMARLAVAVDLLAAKVDHLQHQHDAEEKATRTAVQP